jgi:hypothetical protein
MYFKHFFCEKMFKIQYNSSDEWKCQKLHFAMSTNKCSPEVRMKTNKNLDADLDLSNDEEVFEPTFEIQEQKELTISLSTIVFDAVSLIAKRRGISEEELIIEWVKEKI